MYDSMKDIMEQVKIQAHSQPDFKRYNETNVRENTNCYSHALGLTLPYLTLYRVGTICKRKPIDENFKSIDEIIKLLYLDCEALKLKITESSLSENVEENEYKIALFVSIYSNGHVGYHFWRFDNEVWTEKYRGRRMQLIEDFQRSKLDYYPWKFVGIYKIKK